MTKPEAYQLDIEKLRGQLGDAAYIFSFIGINEEHEYFEQLKPFLIIPEEPKSLEELSQELDENLNKIIEKFKEKSENSRKYAEYRFKQSSEQQNSRFDFARKYGHFSQERLFGISLSNPTHELRISDGVEVEFGLGLGLGLGYWSINHNIRIYRKTKPNRIVRYFSKLLLDFEWKDV
jgi:hypothetical protein